VARKFGLRTLLLLLSFSGISFAQPAISKVEPPSWWRGSSLNPIRVLIRGSNLTNARVQSSGNGVTVVGAPKVNDRGTYLFIDLSIAPNARNGKRTLRITAPQGSADTPFEIVNFPNRQTNFQGFSPDDVMYLIMIDRFADGDRDNTDPIESRGVYNRENKFYYHGGDLQGVIDHLPYLKELGVTALWLTPWYDNYDRLNRIELKEDRPSTAFHGYNPHDFYGVEEHFGTLEKLQELVVVAHRAGFKIIQDQVMNHTGPYHPWVDDPPTPTWFNGTRQKHLNNVFQTWVLHDPRPGEQLKKETMEGWFLDFLPDLNQHDKEVERYLIQNTLWWIGMTGLDGIRMDTWQYVPNSFWQKWTSALKREFPNVRVVGEVKDGDVVHTSFFQGGKVRFDGVDSGLDSLLDFPLFYSIRQAFAEGETLDRLPKTLSADYLYTNPEMLVTLFGGHDDGRFMSEKGATIDGLKLANTFLLTTRGIPQLYYGDELAMFGPDEPTTRKDFPGGFPGDRRNAFTREGRTPPQQAVFEHIQKLNRIRSASLALRRGRLINLHVSPQQYAYARMQGGEIAIIAINNEISTAALTFDAKQIGITDGVVFVDRLGVSREVRIRDGKGTVELPGRSAAILTAK
jgi:glycosidase